MLSHPKADVHCLRIPKHKHLSIGRRLFRRKVFVKQGNIGFSKWDLAIR